VAGGRGALDGVAPVDVTTEEPRSRPSWPSSRSPLPASRLGARRVSIQQSPCGRNNGERKRLRQASIVAAATPCLLAISGTGLASTSRAILIDHHLTVMAHADRIKGNSR